MRIIDFITPSALAPDYHQAASTQVLRLAGTLRNEGYEAKVSHDLVPLAAEFRNRGWLLSKLADPDIHPGASRPDRTIIVTLEQEGRMVGASVQRWIWVDGTLKDACESLRFFYGENIHLARPEERCRVSAPFAENVRDCALVYSCAFHAEQEATRGNAAVALIRLAHALAAMNWHWSYIMGRVRKPLADRYTETYYGFPGWQSGIVVDGPGGVEDPARYVPMADRFFFLKQLTSPIYGDAGLSLADHSRQGMMLQ